MPKQTPLPVACVGLIGLGLMGRGMGLSLLRAGRSLGIVAHRRRETADELLAAGAWEAVDAQALAKV
jgi:3-hydroxyisobutyrate dehydrogenase-like beta-hydroxyacid dehydrogenase